MSRRRRCLERPVIAVPLVAVVFAALAALLHVVFFVFESILWTKPKIWGRFGLTSQQDADTTKLLAYNQGFYNLFLAVGVLVGLFLLNGHSVAGRAIVLFGCLSMALAAVVLISTGLEKLRAALIQLVPPALAVIFAVTL
jgi:putative membrane protein